MWFKHNFDGTQKTFGGSKGCSVLVRWLFPNWEELSRSQRSSGLNTVTVFCNSVVIAPKWQRDNFLHTDDMPGIPLWLQSRIIIKKNLKKLFYNKVLFSIILSLSWKCRLFLKEWALRRTPGISPSCQSLEKHQIMMDFIVNSFLRIA